MDSSYSLQDHLDEFLNKELPSIFDTDKKIQRNNELSHALSLGTTTLESEVQFTAQLLNAIAVETKSWETFEQFKKRLSQTVSPPSKNDPLLSLEAQKVLSKIAPDKIKDKRAVDQIRQVIHAKKTVDYAKRKKEIESLGGHLRPDLASYLNSTLPTLPDAVQTFFSTARQLRIVEFYRERHTLITGGTGSGKSEITKTVAHHYLTKNTSPALVIIDPHGSLAEDIAQFQENADGKRLLYVDLTLKKGFTPVLNPFDVGQLSEEDFDIVSGQVLNLLGIMLSEENQFTEQMKAVLEPCVETLLRLPDTNLEHLKQFFDDDRNGVLKQKALELLTNPSDRDFMKRDFDSASYAPTKQSIRTRLHLLLTKARFRNFVVGKSTIDLKKVVDDRKVICFKLTSQDSNDPVTLALGRLIVGSLLAMTMRRGTLLPEIREKQTPIHLCIDEAHNFSHPTLAKILGESRKYRLHLTLISQYIGKFPHPKVREELESNTALKIAGWQSANSKGGSANEKLMGLQNESLDKLQTGEFFIKALSSPAFRLKNGSQLVGSKHAMTSEQWQAITAEQLKLYYRPIQSEEEAQDSFSYSGCETSSPAPSKTPHQPFKPFKPLKSLDTSNETNPTSNGPS